jgi:hypothetical protein
MVAEQEVEYNVDGKKVQFKIRRIKYGEYQKIIASAGNVELIGGVSKSKIDTMKLVDEIMKISVTGTMDYHELDVQCGTDLQAKVMAFNGMGVEEPFRA